MDRYKKGNKASILGIIGNVFLLVIKTIVGTITFSQAMIADAMNSAGDILSSLMTFIGNKIASTPIDDDHDLGHGKAEYIYSMLISIIMFIMAIEVIEGAIRSLLGQTKYNFSPWIIVVCIITIITKLCLYLYTKNISTKYNNLLIEANAKDHRNDCIVTTFNLLSSLFALLGIYYIDSLVGLSIAIWIIITATKIFKESYDVLMDKSIGDDVKEKVYSIIKKHKEIKKVNHFNSTPIGYLYQISVTIFVDGNMSTFESHDIADRLEKEITSTIPEIFLTVIHVNPIKNNKKTK